jgi:sulfate/thiosulfate transport system ATP-binding protein
VNVSVSHVTKRFGAYTALDDVSFDVESGELVALLGPSGGGKSTILRIIAGLELPDSGSIILGDEVVDRQHPRERRVGFVFQHYALFRHMTVADNVAFGLEAQHAPKSEVQGRVSELLRLVGLHGLEQRFPSQLSGGQRQRVALARALAPHPKILLLDEPFAALDAKVRGDLRRWLRELHEETGVTSLFVTHDQEEAFALADRIVVVNKGRIDQVGSPTQIMDDPATEFVARFVGEANVLAGTQTALGARVGPLDIPLDRTAPGHDVHVVVRSYDLKFWRDDAHGVATVRRVHPLGDRVKVEAALDGVGALFAQFPRRSSLLHGIEPGCRIAVQITKARAYPANP